eukprot:CAMPEP_0197527238 /NCGR_PEP_ID=MMETSP1318-20131121/20823_1 /TAXON_ID=552666 /ORGANISM="Partenskyella glossopodia, Strain RCC365" /LENGTH=229 /DNA_ID=CAMNT_0043081777 /DNA_START=84 /DNA_END=770 /DNA_ORIENTATION=-
MRDAIVVEANMDTIMTSTITTTIINKAKQTKLEPTNTKNKNINQTKMATAIASTNRGGIASINRPRIPTINRAGTNMRDTIVAESNVTTSTINKSDINTETSNTKTTAIKTTAINRTTTVTTANINRAEANINVMIAIETNMGMMMTSIIIMDKDTTSRVATIIIKGTIAKNIVNKAEINTKDEEIIMKEGDTIPHAIKKDEEGKLGMVRWAALCLRDTPTRHAAISKW